MQYYPVLITGAFFCRHDEFICNNTLCKLHSWVCDGEDDCGDNSDEDADMCGKNRICNLFKLQPVYHYSISPFH